MILKKTIIVIVSLLVSAAVAAFLFMSFGLVIAGDQGNIRFSELSVFVVLAFVVALVYAIVLGLPVFIFCLRKGWMQWRVSLFSGFMIGALPSTSIAFFTHKDLLDVFMAFIGLGALGAASGWSAWLTWKKLSALIYQSKV